MATSIKGLGPSWKNMTEAIFLGEMELMPQEWAGPIWGHGPVAGRQTEKGALLGGRGRLSSCHLGHPEDGHPEAGILSSFVMAEDQEKGGKGQIHL